MRKRYVGQFVHLPSAGREDEVLRLLEAVKPHLSTMYSEQGILFGYNIGSVTSEEVADAQLVPFLPGTRERPAYPFLYANVFAKNEQGWESVNRMLLAEGFTHVATPNTLG